MRVKKYILILATVGITFTSCEDARTDSEAYVDYENQYKTDIDTYNTLKSYEDKTTNPSFRLGVGMNLDDFVNNENAYTLATANFDEITCAYKMKAASILQDDGNYNFTDVDKLFAKAKDAGMGIYGHTLVWHSEQNGKYLRSLIAPTSIDIPTGKSILDCSDLADGSFTSWIKVNGDDYISTDATAGINGKPAVKLEVPGTVSNIWDVQLSTPKMDSKKGHRYLVSFLVKSDKDGKAKLGFKGLNNNYASIDYDTSTGMESGAFTINTDWKLVKFILDDLSGKEDFQILFNFAVQGGVTYYLNTDYLSVIDLDADKVESSNLVSNGDFESGNIDGWDPGKCSISAEGEGADGIGYSMKMTSPSAGKGYSSQAIYELPGAPLVKGHNYTISFDAKATDPGHPTDFCISTNGWPETSFGIGSIAGTWTHYTATKVADDNWTKLMVKFGSKAGSIFIDNIELVDNDATTGGDSILSNSDFESGTVKTWNTYVDDKPSISADDSEYDTKTIEINQDPDVIKSAINTQMTSYIDAVVSHCDGNVTAWDVVNEPIDDEKPTMLKSGENQTIKDDNFYWQDYLGKDYAVTAFKEARKNISDDVNLFVNDYGLSTNIAKCKGLIDYVKYCEEQGAQIDGIGTQMHVNVKTVSITNIDKMFKLLAATGKLIRISELDIPIGLTPSPTDYLAQADLYRAIIISYFKNIPAEQRYGITIWGLTDNPSNSNWLPSQNQGIFDLEYQKKLSFKGFIEGMK